MNLNNDTIVETCQAENSACLDEHLARERPSLPDYCGVAKNAVMGCGGYITTHSE